LSDGRLQRLGRGVGNALQANAAESAAVELRGDQDQTLAEGAAATRPGHFTADKSLIDLHSAGQSIPTRTNHRTPQLVQPSPRGPVTAQAKDALQAQSTHSRFWSGDMPNRLKPNPQGLVRVGKQRARRHRKIIPAPLAPVKRRLHRPDLRCLAIGTTPCHAAPHQQQGNQVHT
jgi:hypothetical protein